jgi:hypothetical protein
VRGVAAIKAEEFHFVVCEEREAGQQLLLLSKERKLNITWIKSISQKRPPSISLVNKYSIKWCCFHGSSKYAALVLSSLLFGIGLFRPEV